YDALSAATALVHVPLEPPDEALVGGCVYEDLEVQSAAQFRLVQDQDAFHDDYGRGTKAERLSQPVGRLEVVERPVDRVAAGECVQLLDEERSVERPWLVPVDGGASLEVRVGGTAVVDVLRQHQHLAGRGVRHGRGNGALAAAGAACHPDDERTPARRARAHATVAASMAAYLTAASMKPVKGGLGRMSLDLNSGCDWTARKYGWSFSSIASTSPSPRPRMPGVTPDTISPAALRGSTYSGFTS